MCLIGNCSSIRILIHSPSVMSGIEQSTYHIIKNHNQTANALIINFKMIETTMKLQHTSHLGKFYFTSEKFLVITKRLK